MTAGNDWEESIKALEKLVRRISCKYNEKNATKQDRRAFGLSQAHVLTVVKCHLQLVHAGWRKSWTQYGVVHDMYSNLNTSKPHQCLRENRQQDVYCSMNSSFHAFQRRASKKKCDCPNVVLCKSSRNSWIRFGCWKEETVVTWCKPCKNKLK